MSRLLLSLAAVQLAAALVEVPDAPPLTLITFDANPTTGQRKWSVMNDPVMGGQSHSAYKAGTAVGNFTGVCAIVPFLHAPGFCKIATSNGWFEKPRYADASAYIDGALYLTVRTTTPMYKGFKVAFTAKNATRPHPPSHPGPNIPSFKADFAIPAGTAFSTVKVPFSKFSVDWSDFTGECNTKDPTGTQHNCCSAEHPEVCPKDYHLAKLTGFEVWAEGVEGAFSIELQSIGAGPA